MITPPQRILIHTGVTSRISIDKMPAAYAYQVEFAEEIGAFDPDAVKVKSAIIGYVDVVDVVEDSDSRWAQFTGDPEKPMLHYILSNAHLFLHPILDVKGKLGVGDYPDIDENNLPETLENPAIIRDNTTLIIPLSDAFFDNLSEWYKDGPEDQDYELIMDLFESNIDYFFKDNGENLESLPTEDVIFKNSRGEEIHTKYVGASYEPSKWEDTGEDIEYEDLAGRMHYASEYHLIVARVKPRCSKHRYTNII